ncbi:MAG TPA: hypothetical protein VIW03_01640, partial [Anaeromyxobacter sp.]
SPTVYAEDPATPPDDVGAPAAAVSAAPPAAAGPGAPAPSAAAPATEAASPDAAAARAAGLPLPEPGPSRPAPARRAGPSRWGVLFDAGLPQGGRPSAAFRPVPSVRFFAGPAWNVAGFGIQGGVSVVPWHFAVTPVLTAEAGRYFGADVSFLARGGQGVPPEIKPLLKDMTYTYGAVHVGIEFGSQSGLTFSVDAGLAYLSLETKGTVTTTDSGSGSTVTFRDPRVRGTLPSLNFGVRFWF